MLIQARFDNGKTKDIEVSFVDLVLELEVMERLGVKVDLDPQASTEQALKSIIDRMELVDG